MTHRQQSLRNIKEPFFFFLDGLSQRVHGQACIFTTLRDTVILIVIKAFEEGPGTNLAKIK